MIIFVQTCLNLRGYFDILEKLNIEPNVHSEDHNKTIFNVKQISLKRIKRNNSIKLK